MVRTYTPKTPDFPVKFQSGFIDRMDGRTDIRKRLQATFNQVIDDCGGVDALPKVKLALVERFCFLEEFLRQLELELVKGPVEKADLLGKWIQGVNGVTGLCKLLGVTGPQPKDYIDATLYAPTDPLNTADKAPGLASKGRKGSNRAPSTRSPAP